jgi:hypothetical protein
VITPFTDDQLVSLIEFLEEKLDADYELKDVIDELSGRRTSKSEPVPTKRV